MITTIPHLVMPFLAEAAVGVDLTDPVRRTSAYSLLEHAAAEHCGIVDDHFSAQMETTSGQAHNAVLLAMERYDHDHEQAMVMVNDLATCRLRMFEAAAAASPATAEVRRWVAGVRDLVRGNVDRQLESRRYRMEQTPVGVPT